MVDRIKSALYNITSGGSGGPQDVIGTTLQIPLDGQSEDQSLKIKRILDTGGYGVIYLAQDTQTGQEFAIKRIIAAREQMADIKRELQLHQSLTGHPNILPFISAVTQKLVSDAAIIYLIQTELCPYGNISAILPLPGTNKYLSLPHIFKFFYQTVLAVSHLHSQALPVVHRDLKAENLLLDSAENIKLCDFGSATTQFYSPDTTWTATQRGLLQEDLAKYTTPMYRAPEMLDLYSNQPIDTRADIWALGCLLYHICFLRHPFQEGSTLPILSAQYFFPQQDSHNKEPLLFQSLIRSLIKTIPGERPTADGVIASLFHYSTQIQFDLDALDKVPKIFSLPPPTPAAEPAHPQEKPPEIKREASPSNYYSGFNAFLGRVKVGADSLIKNIKESAQQLRGSPLPLLHLTSRLLVSVVPDERNALAMREVLEREHGEGYLIFNLSGVTYDVSLFNGRVADLVWPRSRPTPEFLKMLDMCKQVDAWLRADAHNVVVLQDLADLTSAIYLTIAYLLYTGLFSSLRAVGTYLTEQLPEPTRFLIQPSLKRYYSYITRLVKDPEGSRPHRNRVCVTGVRVCPCKFKEDTEIVVEILCRDGMVYSSQGETGLLLSAENAVEFTPDTEVESDMQVRLHSTSTKAAVVTTSARTLVCSLQLYSGYMSPDSAILKFLLKDLDLNQASSVKPHDLALQVTYEVLGSREFICPIENVLPRVSSPPSCCSSREECESLRQTFEMKNTKFNPSSTLVNPYFQHSQAAPPPRPAPLQPADDIPLISMDSEEPSTAPALPPRQQAPPIAPRPLFKDTMDGSDANENNSSSSSSSSNSSSSSTSSEEHSPVQDNATSYSLIGEEFNTHPQDEPLISTDVDPQTDVDPHINPTISHSPVGVRQSPPPESLISGLSDLDITPSHIPTGDMGELLTISPHVNPTPSPELLTSNYSNAHADSVMVPDSNSQKPPKSDDPWDLFDMNSLSSKGAHDDLFENKHAKLSSNEPQVKRVPTPTNNTSKPNYMTATTSQPQPTRETGDLFGDILKQSGFPQHKDESHTLNEMNRSNLVEVIGDPDKVRVMEWSKSKQGNIRALISSLHEMAWDGVRWKQMGMHDLMEPQQVKKAYLKASLAFHPDKHIDSPYQNLGRLIIIELNESHTRFEAGGQHKL